MRASLSAGFILGAGFIVPAVWPLVCVGLVPFIWESRKKPVSVQVQAARGFVLGLALYGTALWGIFWHTLPIEWFGINHPFLQIIAVGVHWLLAVFVLSLGTALFAALLPMLFLYKQHVLLLMVPLLWVVAEWLHAHAFALLFVGNGSLLGAHFTFGYLGYVLAENSGLLQLATVGGVYALSCMAVFVNVLAYLLLFKGREVRRALFLLLVVCVGGGITSGVLVSRAEYSTAASLVRVAAVSTYHPAQLQFLPGEAEARVDTMAERLKPLVSVDAVLLPEGAAFATYARDAHIAAHIPLLVDTESVRDAAGDTRAQSIFIYADGRTGSSSKQFILPMGEYLPYVAEGMLSIAANKEFQKQVRSVRSYVTGEETSLAEVLGGFLAVRFCDEAMSPYLYTADVEEGAEVLGNVSSYSWFHGSRLVFQQMQRIAKVRAVENGRWYVQSGNMSPAYVLNDRGMVVTETPWGISAAIEEEIPLLTGTTFYQAFGRYFPIGALFVVGGMLVLSMRRFSKIK